MSPHLVDNLNEIIQMAGDAIQPSLPPHPKHPYGRIGQAHIYDVIRGVMHKPMKQCRDCRYNDIVTIIKFCVEHAEEDKIIRRLRPRFSPEPEDVQENLF